jgi:major inositol transporter-like SP family MFS transporter
MYYGTQLLTVAGFSASAALIANVANGVLAVAGSAICLFLLMDRLPRRTLIVGGLTTTTTTHVLIVIASLLLPEGQTKAFLILILMVTFVFAMQTTLNIPVWVVLWELFPLDMRGFGVGVAVFFGWISNAIPAYAVPVAIGAVGITGTFLVFVLLGLIAIVFLKTLLPETGKRSLEELEEAFTAGNFR